PGAVSACASASGAKERARPQAALRFTGYETRGAGLGEPERGAGPPGRARGPATGSMVRLRYKELSDRPEALPRIDRRSRRTASGLVT
ncbi:hypothetical protein OY671_011086, partial [Metschnikowia pulcherrima]